MRQTAVAGWVAAAALTTALWTETGCAGGTVRRGSPEAHPHPAGVVQVRWRVTLQEPTMFQMPPGECAAAAVAGDRLVLGSRAKRIVGVARATGHIEWSVPIPGGVDSEARFDPRSGAVFLGSDDGTLYAVDPRDGHERWAFRGKGAIERAPAFDGRAVYFTTANDKLYAVDLARGTALWQYERDTPEGFTIHGAAGVTLSAAGALYTGFTDGFLVALRASTGDVLWARSLASTSDQFVDVDTTPLLVDDAIIAGSYSGGLYALGAKDGTVRWRVGLEGAGSGTVVGGRLYLAAPRDGLHAVSPVTGDILWRQGLANAGDLTPPIAVGPYLILTGSRAGMFVIDRTSGQLVELFNPGEGACAPAVVGADGQSLYLLANGGQFYGLSLAVD